MNDTYNRRVWLNKEGSPSTGYVVAFSGTCVYKDEEYQNIFLSVADCHNSARLHKLDEDTVEDFIDKMILLRDEIDLFIKHLKEHE